MDKAANIGVGVGKRSFTAAQILENAAAVLDAMGKAKPASFKGNVHQECGDLIVTEPVRRISRRRNIQNSNRSLGPTMRAEKQYLISEVETHLKKSDYVILANFSKVTVSDVADLRSRLAAEKAEYHVVKNSSLRVAAKALGLPEIESGLSGPTAIVVGGKNPAGVAKVLKQYIEEKKKLEVKVGVLESKLFSAGSFRADRGACRHSTWCAPNSWAC
jgi:large subunit ribosomal protein L10